MMIVLLITALSGPLEGAYGAVFFPTLPDCLAAHKTVSSALSYDHSIACEIYSPRPKRRPEP